MKNKILIICPVVPYPENGAEQSDRANGIRQLVRLGYEVRVIAKRKKNQSNSDISNFSKSVGNIDVQTVSYKYNLSDKTLLQKIKIIMKRLKHFSYLDGAAFEYTDPEMINLMCNTIDIWKPDIVWFEYSYLWPLYQVAQKNKIPIVTRSLNYEAVHFLDEDGRSILNYLKSIPKFLSEKKVARASDLICSITPQEEKIYKRIGARKTINLPLRGLHYLPEYIPNKESKNINIFFMGSTYNVSHNKQALLFIIKNIAPALLEKYGNRVIINITGTKLPESILNVFPRNVIYRGFIVDLNTFLKDMDIAIVPSLFGAGMQQKIFEPLMRGFPVITSDRGIADYPFVKNADYLESKTAQEYINNIDKLVNDYDLRIRLGKAARNKSKQLFDMNIIDSNLSRELNIICDN